MASELHRSPTPVRLGHTHRPVSVEIVRGKIHLPMKLMHLKSVPFSLIAIICILTPSNSPSIITPFISISIKNPCPILYHYQYLSTQPTQPTSPNPSIAIPSHPIPPIPSQPPYPARSQSPVDEKCWNLPIDRGKVIDRLIIWEDTLQDVAIGTTEQTSRPIVEL